MHYTEKFRGVTHSICNLRDKIPKKITIIFHNGSIYDYHFIIKQLAKNQITPNARNCYTCGKRILQSSLKIKIMEKLEIIATILHIYLEAQHIEFVI